jgi:hypothetical protein
MMFAENPTKVRMWIPEPFFVHLMNETKAIAESKP